jgi:predicted aminopeptidase
MPLVRVLYEPHFALTCLDMSSGLTARFIALSCSMLLCGCGTLGYSTQAALGHMDLMARRQPMADVIATSSSSDLKSQLHRVAAIREFASRKLGLPDNGSYRSYAALDRDYPVWNVWVTPAFDLQPRQSCFPVVGCVPYRGYYSKGAAQEYAAGFLEAGDDVMVGGVTAYSTLGFFDDPVTSTMLRLSEERLAGLIFHELAHQAVYVKNNATFNESFARAVEIEGTLRWLESRNGTAGLARYQASLERADIFFGEVRAARTQLSILYASADSQEEKRMGKERIFAAMRTAQLQRKGSEPAWAAYDVWFDENLNNAKLAAVATYFDDVAMFRELFRKTNGDFSAFYSAVRLKAAQLEKMQPSPASPPSFLAVSRPR